MDNKNEQSHGLNYERIHMHDHDHDFVQLQIPATTMKDLVLLEYMVEHNDQHAHELANIGLRLEDTVFTDAATLINDAVRLFHEANEKLGKAVRLVNEG